MSQRARAQLAHNKLTGLLADVNKLVNISQAPLHHSSFSPRENRIANPIRRPLRRTQRRNRRPVWNRRTNPTSPLASPVHNPFPLSPPAPLSPNEDSRLTPEIIDQVISQFPFHTLAHEPLAPFWASIDAHDFLERAAHEGGDIRFDDTISNDEATSLLREFDVNGVDDLGFEALFGLVNCGNTSDELDSALSYFP